MTDPILVTGGTGTLGGHLLPQLRDAGNRLRVLSRRPREDRHGTTYVVGDLLTGAGVDDAVRGVSTVVHLAGGPKRDDEATERLVRAAEQAGVRHLVLISVTQADRLPLAYYRAKAGAERAVTASALPWTVLRAAQFHDLVITLGSMLSKSPLVPMPRGVRFQPVDSREVAGRLAELACGAPAGRVPDLVGPEVIPLSDLLDSYLRAAGKHRARIPVRVPGRAGRVYRSGGNLVLDGAEVGRRTWAEFLAERFGTQPAQSRT